MKRLLRNRRLDSLEEKLNAVEQNLITINEWLEKRKKDKIVDMNDGAFETILDRLESLEKSSRRQRKVDFVDHDTDYDENSPNIWNTYFFPPARN